MQKDQQIKYELEDFNKFVKQLREESAIFIGGNFEQTVRYDYEDLRLSKSNIFIRTKTGFKNVLTIKEKSENIKTNYFQRDKREIEIESTEDLDYILNKIGLTNQLVMEKYRLLWKIDDIYICIDELPFGIYLEIRGDNKQINNILKKFNLKKTKVINETYWDIFNKKIKSEEIIYSKDIKFDANHIFKIATII